MTKTKKFKTKGFVSVYLAFSSFLLIPMAGLAIDFSVLYNVKGRLQSAVDAAAIGAGTMLRRSTNIADPTQAANIQDAAQRYFNSDYPSGYWGSTQVYYSATLAENAVTHVRTIYVHAEEHVPMLFMRVLGIKQSSVAAQATSNVRFVTMMIVVDRSGSVVNGNAVPFIQTALTNFIANSASSVFVDGRDVVGMGSFSGNWNPDFPPVTNFQTNPSNIGTAINNIPFTALGNTNTAEGLHQAYIQLQALGNTGALNVVLLLTDGRPSGFTGSFSVAAGSTCNTKTNKQGFIAANIEPLGTWPPPQTVGSVFTYGVLLPTYCALCVNGENTVTTVTSPNGCAYNSNVNNMSSDIPNFPALDAYGNSTTGPFYTGEGTSTSDPRAVRWASFNAADNMATTIRSDTTIRPVVFVIGLNETDGGGNPIGEPLDAAWLERVANDPNFIAPLPAGQTTGIYIDTTTAGLAAAFQTMASQILRLSQ
jgi:Flp pilus assembly protein TadG